MQIKEIKVINQKNTNNSAPEQWTAWNDGTAKRGKTEILF